MKKRGFTLIELLGVLIVLSIIALIVVPTINKFVRDFKSDSYQNQIKEMCLSVENWKSDHIELLPEEEGETVTITLGSLKNGGYIDYKVKNPLTNKYFPNDMLIELTKVEKNITCKVIENSGNNREDYNIDTPLLTLKGNSTISIDVGQRYEEPGFNATTSTGVTIPKERVTIEYFQNGTKVTGVDSSKNGSFEVRYSVTDKGLTASVSRTVIVKDISVPVITVLGHSSATESEFILNHNAEDAFTLPVATVTDNSKESITAVTSGTVQNKVPGTYNVTYSATDSSGNTATLKVIFVVHDTSAPEVTILGNPTSWTNQSVTIAVNATDDGSGLAENPYSFDGGSTWQSGNTILVESNKTLMIWVKDNTGNIFKDNNVVIDKIDKTIPDVTFAVASGTTGTNYWYKSNVGLKITPTAGSSGVQEYSYCTTKDDSCAPSTKVSGSTVTTATLSNESAKNKVCVSVTSVSGQTNSKCSGNYKIDKTAPVITVEEHTSNYSVSFGPKQSYTIPTGTATDNLTSSVSVTKNGNVTPGTVGTYTVTYSATDDAGNTKTLTLTVNVVEPTYSAWMTESELIAAGHSTTESGIQSKTQYGYQDATTYSSTWTTTKPTYYKSKTQYKVNYSWTEYVSKTCESDDQSKHYYEAGKSSDSWSECGSMCSSRGKGSCVDVRLDGGKYTWTCHASGNSCISSYECGSSTTKTGTTDWQDSNTAPSGKTFVKSTPRTVYAEVTGWGSVTGWQDSAYTETPTRKVTTRTAYRYQTN